MIDQPPENARRTLAAARKLFFQNGFAKTSSVEIARAAGTSKAIIYQHFGDMNGLLLAVIEAEVAAFTAPKLPPISDFESFRESVVGFGATLLEFLNDPQTIHFSRMMHEQARECPSASQLYFDAAYNGTCRSLADLITQGLPYAEPHLPGAPLEAAERYIALLKGHRYEMAVLGLSDAPFPKAQFDSEACFAIAFKRRQLKG